MTWWQLAGLVTGAIFVTGALVFIVGKWALVAILRIFGVRL